MTESSQPPESSGSDPFRFERGTELELYSLLGRVVGEGTAQLFRDACHIMELDEFQLPSHKPHLVGHLLREMQSAVLGVISPLTDVESENPALILCAELELDEGTPAAAMLKERFDNASLRLNTHSNAKKIDACLELLGNTDDSLGELLKNSALHKLAHRRGLSSAVRVVSEEFQNAFAQLVDGYLHLLHLCENSIVLWHQKVDQLLVLENCPRNLQSQLPRNLALFRYLFATLDKPGWIDGLKDKNFFTANVFIESRGVQATYLQKIADQRPQDVLEIMLEADATEWWLLREFTDAAIKMPSEQCGVWATHLTEKIKTGAYDVTPYLMYQVPQFLLRLVELKSETVFDLLATLLEIMESNPEKKYDKFGIRMDRYHYQQVLREVVPAVTMLDLQRTADLLGDILDSVMKIGWPPRVPDGGDRSSRYWLSAIEDHSQNQEFYLEGSIAIALRSVLETSLKAEGNLKDWLQWLEARNSLVYTRMSIHLVRLFGSEEQVKAWLLNKDLFDDSGVLHEYLLLLQEGFPLLDQEGQGQVLGWIDEYPLPDYDASDERLEKHQHWQQYRRLAHVQDHLTGEWKSRFEELKSEVGGDDTLDRLSFDSWSEGARWVKDKSPLPPEELAEMEVDSLLEYLLGDVPVDKFGDVTERGLEKAITEAVSANPAKYVEELERLKNSNLKPFYLHGVTNGLIETEASLVSEEVLFDWFLWCMQQTQWHGQHAEKELLLEHNENKKKILNHLDGRLGDKAENPLSLEYREQMFAIIQAAMEDLDPLNDGQWSDAHSQCINSVRGVAMEAAVDYGLWVVREAPEESPRSLNDLPELKQLLEERLDLGIEPSTAVRTAFGLYLPQLCWMDSAWVAENLERIFPEPDGDVYFAETWKTYLLYSRCYRDTYVPVMPLYERAIEDTAITELEDDGSPCLHFMRLATHYVLFYAWELIELAEEGMFCRFARRAHPSYKAEVLHFMGKILEEENGLPDEVPQRFLAFFEWWEREIAPNFDEGWKAFPHWFKSSLLERPWKVERLQEASKHGSFGRRGEDVLEELLEQNYLNDFSAEVMSALDNFVNYQLGQEQEWVLGYNKSLPELLRAGHLHADGGIKGKADELLGRLVSAGHLKYREIAES